MFFYKKYKKIIRHECQIYALGSVMDADPNALGYVMVARSKTPESSIIAGPNNL
jgi:hypothetical protein